MVMHSRDQRTPARRLFLGVVLGGAAGVFALSLMVLYLRAVVLYVAVFTLGLVLVAPIAGGIWLGIKLVKEQVSLELRWPTLVLLAVILWPLATVLPFSARVGQLYITTPGIIPAHPRAELKSRSVELGDGETMGDRVYLDYISDVDSTEILDFILTGPAAGDWEEGPEHFVEDRRDGTAHWFRHKREFRFMHIKFLPRISDSKLRFEVVYQP